VAREAQGIAEVGAGSGQDPRGKDSATPRGISGAAPSPNSSQAKNFGEACAPDPRRGFPVFWLSHKIRADSCERFAGRSSANRDVYRGDLVFSALRSGSGPMQLWASYGRFGPRTAGRGAGGSWLRAVARRGGLVDQFLQPAVTPVRL
jgi:hypothetical protein